MWTFTNPLKKVGICFASVRHLCILLVCVYLKCTHIIQLHLSLTSFKYSWFWKVKKDAKSGASGVLSLLSGFLHFGIKPVLQSTMIDKQKQHIFISHN